MLFERYIYIYIIYIIHTLYIHTLYINIYTYIIYTHTLYIYIYICTMRMHERAVGTCVHRAAHSLWFKSPGGLGVACQGD